MTMHLTDEGEWKIDPQPFESVTLRSLCDKHPEWLDLPIGVYKTDGSIDFVGASGAVYSSKYGGSDEPEDYPAGTSILVFSAN